MANVAQFNDQQFLSLETFRKNGVGVKTPMWFAQEGGVFYLWTVGTSAKVKRIRNDARVKIAPCKRFGEVTGEWVEANASVDESPAAVLRVQELLRRKVGFMFYVFRGIDALRDRWKGTSRVCLKVTVNAKA